MIRSVTPTDLPQLIRLWQTCFGDPPELIRFFLQRLGKDVSCRVVEESGQLIAVAYLVDAQLQTDGKKQPIWYEYALGTLPTARGRGVMAGLLQEIHREAERRGITYTALVPADAHLTAYYTRLGYHPFFNVREGVLTRDQLEEYAADAGRQVRVSQTPGRIRSSILRNANGLKWSDPAVEFALQFALKGGARVLRLDDAYAIWTESGKTACITEWMGTGEAVPNMAKELLCHSNCAHFALRLPEYSPLFPELRTVKPFGMLYAVGENPMPQGSGAYLGLEMN